MKNNTSHGCPIGIIEAIKNQSTTEQTTLPFTVYSITNPDKEVYIGLTKNLKNRKKGFKSRAKSGNSSPIHQSITLHSFENHTFKVLYRVATVSDGKQLEAKQIAKAMKEDNCLNKSKGNQWHSQTEDTKAKIGSLNAGDKSHLKNKKGSAHPKSKAIDMFDFATKAFINTFESETACAQEMGFKQGNIADILKGTNHRLSKKDKNGKKTWYTFKYHEGVNK